MTRGDGNTPALQYSNTPLFRSSILDLSIFLPRRCERVEEFAHLPFGVGVPASAGGFDSPAKNRTRLVDLAPFRQKLTPLEIGRHVVRVVPNHLAETRQTFRDISFGDVLHGQGVLQEDVVGIGFEQLFQLSAT